LLEIRLRHLFYVSNLLSLLRLFLLIPFVILLSEGGKTHILALVLVASLAIASDFVDGFFARRLNQKSELGRILDPLADKVFMAGGFLGLVIFRGFPISLMVLLIYRDLLIFWGGLFVARKLGRVPESSLPGKLNTVIMAAGGFCFILAPAWIGTRLLLILAYIIILYSGVSYFFAARRFLEIPRAAGYPLLLVCIAIYLIILFLFRNSLL